MTSKDVAKLYPATGMNALEASDEQLRDAADALQTIWYFIYRAVVHRDDLHPATISAMTTLFASTAQMTVPTFILLAELSHRVGTRPDLYGHDDGPLTDCTEMAATLLREVSDLQTALGNKFDDIARFTSCVHTKDPKSEVPQQDS